MWKFFTIFLLTLTLSDVFGQAFPSADENIPYLMVFGNKAEKSWGDDDFSQTFFFLIPDAYKGSFYVRVFDPEVGGEIDELNGKWDTQMVYSFYGGKGCYTDPDAQKTDPIGNYKSGNMLATKSFGVNPKYDNNWYTFGPFNSSEGEKVSKFGGSVFKLIIEGVSGDDGNLFRYFLSTSGTDNKPVEGGNAFSYEYSFRMWDDPNEVSHIYPYVDDRTISVQMANFDWDSDGFIRTVSVARKGQMSKVSGEDEWIKSEFKILEEEKNTSLDIQMIKRKTPPVKNNNVVIYVQNQYGELLPFFTIPIGGVPKYKYNIGVRKVE